MFIKRVIIEGFKSYREKTVLETFHPNLNIIVGENGSGKSNILYAIQFVLSEEFSHLRKDVQQSLMFYDLKHQVVVASVEIIFDNTDRRLPIPSDVVSFSRRIGLKYDQFCINKKVIPHKEMVDVLVSAGFCSCNTYHIVKQGKVNQMATAPDSYRLSVLLDIAGTHVHEDEIQKMKTELEALKQELERDKTLMQTVSEKLEVLAQQKNDLKTYIGLDKTRRALEYCLHDLRLRAALEEVAVMEVEHSPTLKTQKDCSSHQQEVQENVQKTNRLLEDTEKHLGALQDCQSSLRIEEQQVQSQIDEINVKIKMLTDEHESVSEQKSQTQDELKSLVGLMAQNEIKLFSLKPQYEGCKQREEECRKKVSELEQKRDEMYDKLGRRKQFGTKEERDAWLHNELEVVSRSLKELHVKENKMTEELQRDVEEECQLKEEVEVLKKDEGDCQKSITELEKCLFDVETNRVNRETILSEQFRREAAIQQKQSSLQDDLTRARRSLCLLTDKNIIDGLEGLQRVLKKLQDNDETVASIVNGYHGTLLDNFECIDKILTAVEVTAGKRLFYHIVATDEVSSKITKEFNSSQMHGEINFFLLNRLSYKVHQYPVSNNALPLIHKLKYAHEYDKAMQYVFGRTLLCRNMAFALDFANESDFDCITVDGDQAFRSGSLCGGYRDKSKSVISSYRHYISLQESLKEAEDESQKIKKLIKDLKDEITEYSTDKQKLERKIINAKHDIECVKSRRILLTGYLNGLKEVRAKKEQIWGQCRSNLDTLEAHKNALEDELNHEMVSQLSEAEQKEVDQLNDDIRKFTEECKTMFNKRLQLHYDRELLLKNTLTKQHEHLTETLESLDKDSICRSLELMNIILESTAKDLNVIQEQLRDTEEEIDVTKVKQESIQDELKSQKEEEANIQLDIDTYDKELKEFATKKSTLMMRIEKCHESIDKLGVIPVQELTKYRNMGTVGCCSISHIAVTLIKSMLNTVCEILYLLQHMNSELVDSKYSLNLMPSHTAMKSLTEVNKKLKRFHRMNMQAVGMHKELLNKEKYVKSKMEKLGKGYDRALELLDGLETQKSDAVLFTIRQSSENFSRMFKKLVPTGHAQLTMKTSESESIPIKNVTDISTLRGIGISVSFDTNGTQVHELKEMSGGEKSLLALTLIFALQKCSPVPFCVIDEMLDSVYRPSLARLISELSKETQFIVTSHGRDMLDYGDQFYEVKNINQRSRVNIITKEKALRLVA